MGPLVRYFLGLGATGFGGPIALVGYMQRDLVEGRRWISRVSPGTSRRTSGSRQCAFTQDRRPLR